MAERQYFNRFTEKEKRRELRGAEVPAEKKLWDRLRGRQLYGYKFRRQASVGAYVVDFYCPELMLAVEADGESHYESAEAQEADERRQRFIESLGVRVLRFTNPQIHDELDAVIEAIGREVLKLGGGVSEGRTSGLPPRRGGTEGGVSNPDTSEVRNTPP